MNKMRSIRVRKEAEDLTSEGDVRVSETRFADIGFTKIVYHIHKALSSGLSCLEVQGTAVSGEYDFEGETRMNVEPLSPRFSLGIKLKYAKNDEKKGVTMRNVAQGQMVDYAYQVKLADPMANQALIRKLELIDGIRGITYMNQEATVEV